MVQPSPTHDSSVHSLVAAPSSDRDSSITTWKGTCSCVGYHVDRYAPYSGLYNCLRTRHPISNFLSYDRLSPIVSTFVLFLSSVFVRSGFAEALAHLGWRQAMEDK